jgi:hypothetical protein
MITQLNYQEIINTLGLFVAISLPIGILFGMTSKIINLFLSLAFGERNIKL